MEAVNGAEAIYLARKWKPDIIILDLPMLVMNGLEAACELKRMMSNVPILLLGQHDELFRQNADRHGYFIRGSKVLSMFW